MLVLLLFTANEDPDMTKSPVCESKTRNVAKPFPGSHLKTPDVVVDVVVVIVIIIVQSPGM